MTKAIELRDALDVIAREESDAAYTCDANGNIAAIHIVNYDDGTNLLAWLQWYRNWCQAEYEYEAIPRPEREETDAAIEDTGNDYSTVLELMTAATESRCTYTVEEHLGGRDGIGKGARTGNYPTKAAAVMACAAAISDGHKATAIRRVRDLRGTALQLDFVAAI